MKTLALAVAAVPVLVIACGGGESETDRLVRESIANMDALDSYRMEIAETPDGSFGRVFEFDGEITRGQWPVPADTIQFDDIDVRNVQYTRTCRTTCDPWHRTELPEQDLLRSRQETFSLAAASVAGQWQVVDKDTGTLHVSGRGTFVGAAKADLRRNGEAAGFDKDTINGALKGFTSDDEPMAIEVWIDTGRSLVTRIMITGTEDDTGGFYADATFSAFNNVTVDVPTGFVESE